MSLSPDILMIVGFATAIALVIAVVLVSRWIPPNKRKMVERSLAAVSFPAAAIFTGWRGLEHWRDGDWLASVASIALAAALLALAFAAIRPGRPTPAEEPGG